MKVKFMFDSDLCWHTERTVVVSDYTSDKDIEAMFPDILGVQYNTNDCRYEAIDGKILNEDQMLAYTE